MHIAKNKNFSWLMIFVLFITWSSIPPDLAFAAKMNKPSKEEFEQAAQKLEKLFDALEEAAKEIPRDSFDPKTIVEKVGTDPEKIFEWVRDNTYLVPYRGSLRGPIGVLMDRLGNSLDRALLLHKLLTMADHKAQLVQGSLNEEQAENVMKEVRPIPPEGAVPPVKASPEALKESIARYAEKYGLDLAELQKINQSMTFEQQHMAEEVAQRVAEQTKAILNLIGEIPDIREAEWKKAIKALQDHWWVRCDIESNWVDLDPTLPKAKSGEDLANEENTYQPDDLDENHLHLVTIRIIIERWEKGELKPPEEVFEHTLLPSELFGKRLTLRHVPLNWPKEINLFEEDNPLELLKTAVLEEKEWLPVLSVGSEHIWKSSFTEAGTVNKAPGKEPGSEVGGVVRRGFSLFGTVEEESKKESHLTAEWIEYEIQVGSQPNRKIRRQLFDLIGPAARLEKNILTLEIAEAGRLERGFAVLGETQILVQVCQLSPGLVTNWTAENLLSNREILTELLLQRDLEMSKNLIEQARQIKQLPGPGYTLALMRRGWSRLRANIYLDRANIFGYYKGLRLSTQSELLAYEGFDIVSNEVAIHSQSGANPFLVRLEQGVLDTNAEALIMRGSGEVVENTAEIFIRSKPLGTEWITVKDAINIDRQNAELPKNVRALIEKNLSEGYLILAPRKSVTIEGRAMVGWWRVDLTSGGILGIGQSGKGGSTYAERAILAGLIVFAGYVLINCRPDDPDFLECMADAVLWGGLSGLGFLARMSVEWAKTALYIIAAILVVMKGKKIVRS